MIPSIIIFASGKGSNAKAIIESLHNTQKAKVSLIVSNIPTAGVLEIAQSYNIPSLVVPNKEMNQPEFINILKSHNPSLIILAGYLKKIQSNMVNAFPNQIINLHPALLPKFGGKGMYGKNVHEAVLAANESQSGITIHYVNEHYDEGNILLQATCTIIEGETIDSLANKIHQLEHFYLPKTIEFLLKQESIKG